MAKLSPVQETVHSMFIRLLLLMKDGCGRVCLVEECPSLLLQHGVTSSAQTCDQLKPLSQSITQCNGQRVYVTENDVEREGKLFHVGLDLGKLTRSEDWHFNVQYWVSVDGIVQNHKHQEHVSVSGCPHCTLDCLKKFQIIHVIFCTLPDLQNIKIHHVIGVGLPSQSAPEKNN